MTPNASDDLEKARAECLKAICNAGDLCSCADRNYQWRDRFCEAAISHAEAITSGPIRVLRVQLAAAEAERDDLRLAVAVLNKDWNKSQAQLQAAETDALHYSAGWEDALAQLQAAKKALEELRVRYRDEYSLLGKMQIDRTQSDISNNWQGGKVNGLGDAIMIFQSALHPKGDGNE